ncbi:hypothetical protein D3C78_818030 [compost metagenome]
MRAVGEQADRCARLIVAGGDQAIECCAAIQGRVGRLAALVVSWLAVSNEIREVLRPRVGHDVRTLEPVGRGFEHVLVVGAAAGRHRVQNRLQLSQRIRVIEVHRHRLVDLGVEVHQEDVHRARVAAQALLEGVEHRRQRVLGRVDRRGTHTAGAVDHEGDIVVLTRYDRQPTDIRYHDVIGIGAGDIVIICGGSDRVIDRWIDRDRNLRRIAGRITLALGRDCRHGQRVGAGGVRCRGVAQLAYIPPAEVDDAVTGCAGKGVRAIGQGRTCRDAADRGNGLGFRAISVH